MEREMIGELCFWTVWFAKHNVKPNYIHSMKIWKTETFSWMEQTRGTEISFVIYNK
jgi:hypothetical protein